MGDTANWEFAAAVAAVSIGLGGLLLFTVIGALASWRIFERANAAAAESVRASMAVQELARSLSAPPAAGAGAPATPVPDARALSDLRVQADALMEQQRLLREGVRRLAGTGRERPDYPEQLESMENDLRRLEEQLSDVAAAVANLMASTNAR